jgi:hypothetical protein
VTDQECFQDVTDTINQDRRRSTIPIPKRKMAVIKGMEGQ